MTLIKVGQTFDSWEEFEVAKKQYSKGKNVQYVIDNSRTVSAANKKLAVGRTRYDDKLKYAYVKLVCKHFGAGRKQSRGIRPQQRYAYDH